VVTWTVMPWSLGRSIRGHLDAQLAAVWPPGANGLARIWLWPGIARELWLLAPRFWLASDAAGIRFRAARRERELLDLVAPTGFVPATEVPPGPGKTALEERLMRLGWGGPGDQTERAAVLREPDRPGGAAGRIARCSRVQPRLRTSVAGDHRRGWRCRAPCLDPATGNWDSRRGGTGHPHQPVRAAI
jgi:hypothetical protein